MVKKKIKKLNKAKPVKLIKKPKEATPKNKVKEVKKPEEPKKAMVKMESPSINLGRVELRVITDEIQESYLDYAMSVIVARALPDVRDGLKPVHRRILYAMWDIGLRPGAKFRKSATVVGEVLGKYHPHGDIAVYDSLVRMAQDFSMRYPLVAGQGNFGSMDGDRAAAMRYTEAKLASIAEELLLDIEKETVTFIPNYDGAHKEPVVLPAKLPNLLLNGTMGIAVGMATNIPPHNLGELCDGIVHLIEKPDCTIDDLMEFVKGPDFPTGGIIYNINDIKQAYATGKGGIVMRAKAEIVETKTEHFQIIISEIPYQINKASLLEKIAFLVQEKKIEGIKDLRDESSKGEVRIVIDLKKDSYPKKILNQLFKMTELQGTFHVNMLALVEGIQPRVLTLKTILEEYIKHRKEVIRRRTEFDLNRAKERAHILEGLVMALEKIDKIIQTIKKSKDREEAKINLIKKFRFSERQAVAILEMKLQQLANLERIKVEEELKEKKKLIKELESILSSPKKILGLIKDELKNIKDKYGDPRRTQIVVHGVKEFAMEDLIPDEPTIVTITRDGYIKRLPPETFKTQSRGGKGIVGFTTKEEDVVSHFFATNTHADLLFFTTRGRVFQLKAYDVPQASRTAKGQALVNFLQLSPNEKVSAVLSLAELKDYKFLVMATRQGLIKKVDITDVENVRRSGLIAIKLKGDDVLEWTRPSTGSDEITITTANGQAIRFKEKQIRSMGRGAAGVRGIRLKRGDQVVDMDIIESGIKIDNLQLLIVMEKGFGKRSNVKLYRLQGRGGSGIKTAKITDKTGKIVAAKVINAKDIEGRDLIIISEKGQVIRLPFKSISVLGRATQGVRLMRFKEEKDSVANAAFI
jgi:DNA gyrase subunit A